MPQPPEVKRATRLILPLLIAFCGPLAPPRAAPARPADAPAAPIDAPAAPVRVHPDNPKYFLFRGRPTVLLVATEHYGSVLNRPFDFGKYLDDLVDKKMTHTRTFLLFRELESASNPASPCKPDSADYIAPWPRWGPAKALDGEPVYNLDVWNPEYFDRLHKFLAHASKNGIVVELTLFSNAYHDGVWALNPLRAENNLQGVGKVQWPEYTSLKDPQIVERQLAYARKIVQETAHQYDNIYYEICNEPGGGQPGHVTPAEVDAWQQEVGRVVREELAKAKRDYLVVGSQAFSYTPVFTQPLDETFSGDLFQAVNVHPLPGTVFGGRTFHMGNFMSKELHLGEFRDFFTAVQPRKKPVISDEDNAATMFRDDIGWTIHRKRAWTALMCGAHYDFIDFSVQIGLETGTPESSRKIRTWVRHLSEFFHSIDFVRAGIGPTWLGNLPPHIVASGVAVEGEDYAAYLADAREVTDAAAGHPIEGKLTLTLPAGSYQVSLYSPVAGTYAPAVTVEGGKPTEVELPPFRHDVAVRATRVK